VTAPSEEDQARHNTLVTALNEAGFEAQEIQAMAALASRIHNMAKVNKLIVTDDLLKASAANAKRQFDAFVAAGFKEDQAIQMVSRNPMSINLTG